jgi:hypothetical protein
LERSGAADVPVPDQRRAATREITVAAKAGRHFY